MKFYSYNSDSKLRKIKVNIWRGKGDIIFQKNSLIKALLYFRTAFLC